MTTISVVISTWNRPALLERAIQSALSQTLPPLEVLVCDDGSTDTTEHVVRLINDPRVIWLPGEHSGRPAVPRNRGIRNSRGEWLAFLDDDDFWLPEKLELQMDIVRKAGCAASCTDAFRFLSGVGRQGCLLGLEVNRLHFEDLLVANSIVCSSVMVSSAMVRAVGGFPEVPLLRAIEDYALWLRLSTMTSFAVVQQPLLEYRDIPNQSIRKDGCGWPEQQRAVLDDFCTWAEQRGSSFLASATEARSKLIRKNSLMCRLLDLVTSFAIKVRMYRQ